MPLASGMRAGSVCALATWLSFCVAASGFAQDDAPKSDAIDAQLLDDFENSADDQDLDAELLKGLDDELGDLPPARRDPNKSKSEKKSPFRQRPDKPNDLDDQLLDEAIGEDIGAGNTGGDEENPLSQITRQMRAAEQLLRKAEEVESTRQVQQKIVDDLAALIEAVRNQPRQRGGSSQPQMPQPKAQRDPVRQPQQQPGQSRSETSGQSRESNERQAKREVQRPDMAEMNDLMKELWGHLPDRMREQLIESMTEQFLPKYELQIEDYFRRLAEDSSEQRP